MQGYQQQPASPQQQRQPHMAGSPQLNTGVAQFMNGVYAWMAAGLAVTAAIAWGISQSPEALQMFFDFNNGGFTGLGWVAVFAPLPIVFIFGSRMMNMSRGAAVAVFMVLSVTYGCTFSLLPLMFNVGAIFKAFFATTGMFAAMAAFGYVTKKDLTGFGQFLIMAVFGIIIAQVVNMFWVQSHSAHMAIDGIVVLVFAGLTAYHTQKIKQFYLVRGATGNIAIIGALSLYLDFINIFISLLHLFGGRE